MNEEGQTPPDQKDRRADAPHPRRDRSITSQVDSAATDRVLGSATAPVPAMVERLEALDDLVFEAIAGKPGAIEQLRREWPAILQELGPELVEESRSQYLRHAMSVWKDCIAAEEIRNPQVAIAAIDVIDVLLASDAAY